MLYNILLNVLILPIISSKIIVEPSVGYDIHRHPNETVSIIYGFKIETISEINPHKQTVKLTLEINLRWKESRLEITKIDDGQKVFLKRDSYVYILKNSMSLLGSLHLFSGSKICCFRD